MLMFFVPSFIGGFRLSGKASFSFNLASRWSYFFYLAEKHGDCVALTISGAEFVVSINAEEADLITAQMSHIYDLFREL